MSVTPVVSSALLVAYVLRSVLMEAVVDAIQLLLVRLGVRRAAPPKEPTAEEYAELGVLWQMLHLHLHPNWPTSDRESQDNRHLTRAEFQLAFGLGWNAAIIKRIFDMLDSDGDDAISLDDFTIGLFPLASVRATLDDRLRFLFRCFDLDGSGYVSREDLLLHLHLYATQGLYADDCAMTFEQLEAIVRATFEQAEEIWEANPPRSAAPSPQPAASHSPALSASAPSRLPPPVPLPKAGSPGQGTSADAAVSSTSTLEAASAALTKAAREAASTADTAAPAAPAAKGLQLSAAQLSSTGSPGAGSSTAYETATPRTPYGTLDRISWWQFDRMLRSRPLLVEQMLTRLGLDVTRAIADLVMSLDDRWLVVDRSRASGRGHSRCAARRVGVDNSGHLLRATGGEPVRQSVACRKPRATRWAGRELETTPLVPAPRHVPHLVHRSCVHAVHVPVHVARTSSCGCSHCTARPHSRRDSVGDSQRHSTNRSSATRHSRNLSTGSAVIESLRGSLADPSVKRDPTEAPATPPPTTPQVPYTPHIPYTPHVPYTPQVRSQPTSPARVTPARDAGAPPATPQGLTPPRVTIPRIRLSFADEGGGGWGAGEAAGAAEHDSGDTPRIDGPERRRESTSGGAADELSVVATGSATAGSATAGSATAGSATAGSSIGGMLAAASAWLGSMRQQAESFARDCCGPCLAPCLAPPQNLPPPNPALSELR